MMVGTTFESIEAFYDADKRRRHSGEADYGVHWRGLEGLEFPRYRVSFIRDTGEVYAVSESRPPEPVILLGTAPVDDVPVMSVYYKTLNEILDGWPEATLAGETYEWVQRRIKAANDD